jgi:arylsulfatase
MPADRAIDGIDQIDILLGNSAMGQRECMLSFIGAALEAVAHLFH